MSSFFINPHILGTSIGNYQPETSAWITRTEAAGGTLPTGTKDAVDAFVVSCKAAGFFTKFKRLNLFCGSNLTACLSPLVITNGNQGLDTNSNFISGDYTQAGGLVGGTGKGLNTGFVPDTSMSYVDWHMASYMIARSDSLSMELGCLGYTGGNVQFRQSMSYGVYQGNYIGNIVISGDYNNGSNPAFQTVGSGITAGMMLSSRRSASSLRVRNTSGSIDVHTTTTVNGLAHLPTNVMWAMCANNAEHTHHTLGAYGVGLGLSDTEMGQYCAYMETFQTAMGRNRG